jgi:hypothetical protein
MQTSNFLEDQIMAIHFRTIETARNYVTSENLNDCLKIILDTNSLNELVILTQIRPSIIENLSAECCRYGSIDCLQYCITNGYPKHPMAPVKAASGGYYDALVMCTVSGFPKSSETTLHAARNGHLLCLVYASESGYPVHPDALSSASMNGHSECVKYLVSRIPVKSTAIPVKSTIIPVIECCSDGVLQAAQKGHVACLRRLSSKITIDISLARRIVITSAINGQLNCLKECKILKYPVVSDAIRFSLEGNHPECALYCLRNGYYSESIGDWAVRENRIDFFSLCVQNGIEIKNQVIEKIFSDDRQELLKIIERFIVKEDATLTAAKYGSQRCLKYLTEKNYKKHDYAAVFASSFQDSTKHIACKNYCEANGYLDASSGFLAMVERNDISLVNILTANGITKHFMATVTAAKHNNYGMLINLIEKGYPKNPFACLVAAKEGHLTCLMICINNGFICDTETAKREAKKKGQTLCLNYLISLDDRDNEEDFSDDEQDDDEQDDDEPCHTNSNKITDIDMILEKYQVECDDSGLAIEYCDFFGAFQRYLKEIDSPIPNHKRACFISILWARHKKERGSGKSTVKKSTVKKSTVSPKGPIHIKCCIKTREKSAAIVLETIRQGHLDCLKYCIKNGFPKPSTATKIAASYGHLAILRHLTESDFVLHEETAIVAAENGHLSCLKYCSTEGYPKSKNVSLAAAKNGHLNCLKHCTDKNYPRSEYAVTYAEINGHMSCVRYCRSDGYLDSERVMLTAAKNGDLKELKYFVSKRLEKHPQTTLMAAKHGHLDVLEYCTKAGFPKHKNASMWAACNGHLACLKHCTSNGYYKHPDAKKKAVENRKTPCAKHCRENGYP